jgi:hypothetical protein
MNRVELIRKVKRAMVTAPNADMGAIVAAIEGVLKGAAPAKPAKKAAKKGD